MKISVMKAGCIAVAALAFSCVRRETVLLSVDFSTRDAWSYDFDAAVGGRVTTGDSAVAFTHTLRCRLSGKPDTADRAALSVTAGGISIESSMLDDDERENIRRLLDGFTLSFSLRRGLTDIGDSLSAPLMPAGQWDMYRHFAKMLPVLPEGRVRPGFTWDRHAQVPLPTRHGDAVGHLYQSFRFDSLTGEAGQTRLAHLSWRFSYAVETGQADTAGLLDEMPHKGGGKGTAVIDMDSKSLREAAVEFIVPQGSSSDAFSIEWNEKASIKIIDD